MSIVDASPYPVSFEPQDLELTLRIDFSEPSCEFQEQVCTMEFMPTTCTFAGEEFSGANRCFAMTEAKIFACENSLAFRENMVSCQFDLDQ